VKLLTRPVKPLLRLVKLQTLLRKLRSNIALSAQADLKKAVLTSGRPFCFVQMPVDVRNAYATPCPVTSPPACTASGLWRGTR
jgi:hypothetical protein